MTASANSAAVLFCAPDAGSKSKRPSKGKAIPTRADLRYGEGPDGRIFILNKWDGVIREIVP